MRPLVQITGEGEFNEVFIDDARIPDENVVGGVGNGWGVAITTLMNERAGLAFGAIAQIQNRPRRAARAGRRDARGGGTAAEDSYFRQRLAQLYIEAETMRLNAYRGLTKTMQSGIPGPEGSLGKWQWADINQDLTELALEIEGAYAPWRAAPSTRSTTAPGSTGSCARAPTRSRAGRPTSSRTSSPSACWACRGSGRKPRCTST